MSKKRKASALFSPEGVKSRLSAKESVLFDLENSTKTVRNLDITFIVSNDINVPEDASLVLLLVHLGLRGTLILGMAMKHVPKYLTMTSNRWNNVQLRIYIIHKIMVANGVPISLTMLETYLTFIEHNCSDFNSSFSICFEKALWGLTSEGPSSFNKFIGPPISNCFICSEELTMHNHPSSAIVFSLEGPIPSTKVTLECRKCEMSFGVSKYKDANGEHLYPLTHAVEDVIEVSNVTYIDSKLYKWLPSLSNHSWVSFSGFAESYNEVHFPEIEEFASKVNYQVLPKPSKKASYSSTVTIDNDDAGDDDDDDFTRGSVCGELSAKVVAKAFWKKEAELELESHGLRDKWIFSANKGALCGSYDDIMEYVDKIRCQNLYLHNCSTHCKEKGCGILYVADGNWKLKHAHCMWKVPLRVAGFGEVSYPNVCPLTPVRGKAFCEEHCKVSTQHKIPTDLHAFLKHCGVTDIDKRDNDAGNDTESSAAKIDVVEKQLLNLSKVTDNSQHADASTFQGTKEFLESNPAFVQETEETHETLCNKDTGGRNTLQCWSRGIFFIVSGGGHIEYWQPLYRSESPTQAFIILLLWIYRKFKPLLEAGKSHEDIKALVSQTVLCYDNMCHVDNMKTAKKNLPLEPPLNTSWQDIGKVIDRLHIKNHKASKCHKEYNPEKIPKEFNTMAAEQTFTWASRMKKIICAMPRLHQFFFLHRSIKRRNAYTERCHLRNKDPVLPKVKHY